MTSTSSPTSASAPLGPLTRIGHYEIVERLGAGAMGEVYRARDTRLGREVALKTVAAHRHTQPDAVARFEQEARAASALNHPGIVTIYELGQVDGTRYIAMELVAGVNMREMLAAGPLPFRKTVALGAEIAEALASAHEAGIVHRDLKPDNIMVSSEGRIKVLDFGLAKLEQAQPDASTVHGVAPLTEPGRVMGTYWYMSPEQANGAAVDFRSDQFSLGALLYELITGHAPFERKTVAETMAAVLRDEAMPIGSQAPAPFVWIIERCLSKDPRKRYASTRDLARDLVAVRDRMAEAQIRPPQKARVRNLPPQRNALIGRQQEAASLRQLLERGDVRLITLTGPGGIGKTRLAVHVAEGLDEIFRGGITFVSLASIADPGLVLPAIAQASGVSEATGQSPQAALHDYLARLDGPVLFLLDNFEHLVGSAPQVADLLSSAPNVIVLVTSQAPLHIYGEHEFRVPPLELPANAAAVSIESLARLPAIALFTERAQAAKRDFVLTKENAAAVAAICTRLDGMPLAIELAAARIKLLSPAAMQARLEKCLQLLTAGARDLPARQQTLRGTVEWSYSLLDAAEQTLVRRLAVFVGGCTLEGVEAVCDTKGDLGVDLLDAVGSIVDKNLIRQSEDATGEARFSMLSAIREYALERLAASGEEAATRRAHAAYCLVLAEECTDERSGPARLEALDVEHDNLRAALEYLIGTGEVDWALRLGAALFRFWETREHVAEGRDFILRLLHMPGSDTRAKLRARLLFAAAVLASVQGDYAGAEKMFAAARDASGALADECGVAVATNGLAVNARDRGDLATSRRLFEQCAGLWRGLADYANVARALSNLASVLRMQRDFGLAAATYDEALRIFRDLDDRSGVAWALNYRGDLAREQDDVNTARSFYEQSLGAFRELRDGWGIASTMADLAVLDSKAGEHAGARRRFTESINLFQELGHTRGVARVFESMAVAAVQSNAADALRLAGAAAALRQRIGSPLNAVEQARLEQSLEPARQALASGAQLAAWMEGWSTPQVALERALGAESGVRLRGGSSSG